MISGDDLKEGDVIRSSADLTQGIVTGSSDDSADFFFTAGGDEPIGGADAPAGGEGAAQGHGCQLQDQHHGAQGRRLPRGHGHGELRAGQLL